MDKRRPKRKDPRPHRRSTKLKRPARQERVTGTPAQDPHALAPRLQHLMQAIAASPEPLPTHLSCAECEPVLEFYVDAEARGEEVRTRFPRIWKHLKSCKRCRRSYQLLTRSEGEEPLPEFDPPMIPAPMLALLRPQAIDARWKKHVRPRVAGAPLAFGLDIQTLHLRQRFATSHPLLPVRGRPAPSGGPAPSKQALVLSDTIPLGDRDVVVKIWLQRQADPEFVGIEVRLACSSPLPDPLQLKLTWNGHVHTGLVHGSRYSFDKLPASALEGEDDLQVEFVASAAPDRPVEEHSGGDLG